MYKLLTTAAVILTVATPSIANEWTGGKALVQDLETIYNNLDGNPEFNKLQGNNGELNEFFSNVDQGVTHLTLTVGTDNTITPVLNEGVSFDTIQVSADNLVNRINYDLFFVTKDPLTGVETSTYDVAGGYDKADVYVVTPTDDGTNGHTVNQSTGLVGIKVTEVITSTNKINEGLLAPGLTDDNRKDFITEYNNGDGVNKIFNTIDVADYQATIGELNTAVTTANNAEGVFFGNNELEGFSATTVNNFVIPSYNNFEDIGLKADNLGGYSSISAWANGVQSVTVGDKTGTVATTGTITIVSAEAGSESISDGTDTFTWDADSSSFTK